MVSRFASAVVSLSLVLAALSWQSPAQSQDKSEVVKLTAEALGKEFDANEDATTKKYDRKKLEISGTVKEVFKVRSTPYVSLEGSKSTYGVRCDTKETEPWAKFAPGQKVKIVGNYDSSSYLRISDCEVTAIDASPAIKMTAEKLAMEFASDGEAAGKRYTKKIIILSGTVTAATFLKDSGFTDVTLKGSGKIDVECRLHNTEEELGKRLKAGQKITLAGPFSLLNGNTIKIGLSLPVAK